MIHDTNCPERDFTTLCDLHDRDIFVRILLVLLDCLITLTAVRLHVIKSHFYMCFKYAGLRHVRRDTVGTQNIL